MGELNQAIDLIINFFYKVKDILLTWVSYSIQTTTAVSYFFSISILVSVHQNQLAAQTWITLEILDLANEEQNIYTTLAAVASALI